MVLLCECMNVSVLFIQQNCRFNFFFSFSEKTSEYTFFSHENKNSLMNRLQTDLNDLKLEFTFYRIVTKTFRFELKWNTCYFKSIHPKRCLIMNVGG